MERGDLIMLIFRALSGCVSGDLELNTENGSIAIVGEGENLFIIERE